MKSVDKLFKKAVKKKEKIKKLEAKIALLKEERDVVIHRILETGITETQKYTLSYRDITPSIVVKDKYIEMFGAVDFTSVASVKLSDAEVLHTRKEMEACLIKGTPKGFYEIKAKVK